MKQYLPVTKTSKIFTHHCTQLQDLLLMCRVMSERFVVRRCFMTANQINYARHREDVRHNVRSEQQRDVELGTGIYNAHTNRMNAHTQRAAQREQGRHNLETEAINWFQSHETQRHNQVSESQFQQQLEETGRHNRATEELGVSTLAESIRHNSVVEAETARSNRAQEALSQQRNAISAGTLEESRRHNQAVEMNEARKTATEERRVDYLHDYQVGQLVLGKSNAQSQRISANAAASQAYAANRNAEANMFNAETRASELSETILNNSRTRAETNRHNMMLEGVARREAESKKLSAEAAMSQARARQREVGIKQQEATTNKKRAEIAEYEARTNRGVGITRGISNVTEGIKNITVAGKNVSGIAKDIMGGTYYGQTSIWR